MSELERLIRERGTIAVNIQFDGDFKVHVRDNQEVGFTCAQKAHGSLDQALREHFRTQSQVNLLDLL